MRAQSRRAAIQDVYGKGLAECRQAPCKTPEVALGWQHSVLDVEQPVVTR